MDEKSDDELMTCFSQFAFKEKIHRFKAKVTVE
jgi:hypothetical protein